MRFLARELVMPMLWVKIDKVLSFPTDHLLLLLPPSTYSDQLGMFSFQFWDTIGWVGHFGAVGDEDGAGSGFAPPLTRSPPSQHVPPSPWMWEKELRASAKFGPIGDEVSLLLYSEGNGCGRE